MTNNDNCIRTLLNTSLASKSPKIFPMGHTRDIHGYIHTNLSTQIFKTIGSGTIKLSTKNRDAGTKRTGTQTRSDWRGAVDPRIP